MLCYVELVAPLSPPGHRRATCPTEDDWLWGRAKTKSRGAAPRLGGVSGCEDEYKRSPEDYLIIDLICLIYVPIYYGIYVYIYIHIFVVDVCSWFMYMLCTYIWYITYYIQYTSTKSLYIYIYIHMWHVFSFPTMVWGRKQGYQLDNVLKATIMVRKSWSFEATSLGQWVN